MIPATHLWQNGVMMPSRSRGFTFVEILVVLAIIAVLASILFAVFNRVRENGRQASCQSNLKQIFNGLEMYMQDNDSRLPYFSDWVNAIHPYTKSRSIFLCPTTYIHNQYHPDVDYTTYPERVSYLNINRSGKITHSSAHEASIVQTGNWILMTDVGSGEEGGPQPSLVMLTYSSACAERLTRRGTRSGTYLGRDFPIVHSGGGNYLFADGHVKWLRPETGLETDCAAGPFLAGN